MSLDKIQQLKKLLDASHYILVVFSHEQDTDSVASALAWKKFLEKKHKQTDVVCFGFTNHHHLRFLSGAEKIKPALSHLQKFTIKVDISNTKIDSLSYNIKDNWLSIHLNPKQGTITKDNLRTAQSSYKYDLIITINTPDLESLGEIFSNNTDLFYRLPVINIDHDLNNENYGALNFIELPAASSSENIYKIFKKIDETAIDQDICTMLLTGIITQTRSFKTANITPFTLNIASELMTAGARREEIIKNLYYNRSIPSLKIWGQALTHLQNDPAIALVWTSITRDELARSLATPRELSEVIDELIINSPQAKIILLLYEKEDGFINGILACEEPYDALDLLSRFEATGNKKRAYFALEKKSLSEAQAEILRQIRQKIKHL
ncbi:MAG: hypothetical protein COU31_00295 [Candidatus Magasanikbacteria bacterium CG10_big_fil_rev_8_21_14_0_10_40_10]|uniref:DDH domain-containing protein n=1 Tax=Candidatus Magasanikbacteria bacterium CG10_big_fil_rev_8_21_14_0_10_40_10 TaxID=1974648 RepID=A0A2M6W543_9BACT|nr:MAG: hypothetical protein COU31_00295 [Candidatus Magasanikbacteria bacterium CG10_big_fil_rev_8_21_14_0_10_40_10]